MALRFSFGKVCDRSSPSAQPLAFSAWLLADQTHATLRTSDEGVMAQQFGH